MARDFEETIKWYDENAATYANAVAPLSTHKLLNRFAEYVPKNSAVLDAGCAAGRDSNHLSRLGYQVTGVDMSSSFLQIARANYPDINFVQANFLQLPFADQTFQGVWSCASLVHFETTADVLAALREFNRVLHSDGYLFVLVKQLMNSQQTTIVKEKSSSHGRFYRWFNKAELNSLLHQANFQVLEMIDNYPDLAHRTDVKLIVSYSRK